MTYEIYAAKSGVTITSSAKTLLGAKREATGWACFGAGDIFIVEDGVELCVRRFCQGGNRFWWSAWESV